jgi:hypothetical protein
LLATSNSGLSSGAKAGIGVGVAAGAIALLALVLGMLFFRKRKAQRQTDPNMSKLNTKARHPYDNPPLAYVEADALYPYVEADAQEARQELQA